jgi:hypothetical protein
MSSYFRHSLAWLLGLAAFYPAQAQGGLTTESPFLPSTPTAGAPTENVALEFRGVIVTGEGPTFLIVDATPPTKKGAWVKPNETGREFTVKSYDAQNDTVSVDFRGRLLSLALAKSKVGSAGMPMIGTAPGGQPPIGGPISPVVLNPTAADEANRLAAVTQEVLRRRQMRQQTPPPPGSPQVQPQPQSMPTPSMPTPQQRQQGPIPGAPGRQAP